MIEAKNLSKRFGDVQAVRDVSFAVRPGQVVGFLGLNGSGKSTTMRMLSGVLAPDHGSAWICRQCVVASRRQAQSLLGYLPETVGGCSQLSVVEFLMFAGQARGLFGQALRRGISRIVETVGLGPVLTRCLRELSKGWRQRVWLAQSLVHDPPVLILDEPTDGLDPAQKDRIRALVRRLAADKAILLSTHVLEEAEELCDRFVIVSRGRVMADGHRERFLSKNGRLGPAFRDLSEGLLPADAPGR